MSEDWITTAEAAEISKYNPEHLRRLIREGKINANKFGIVWQVSRSSLLTYINSAENQTDKRWGPK